ncbi:AraC family transcriptional regulator [Muriicola sp. Z0-33]|uniref:AraC family transcriptional regulator n=1 Tax=Muriicola sp. Z0-33 TaxID=2816957 RepID=UPI0022381FC6|nr:helix-turn-helix domain-containing protein [Muriicola sp. Z0-33]MCW5515274.1 AraC family transcriptional regulator [Muriicola sp. Z0-33]
MGFSDILLILISSAGLLHGVFFASYLCFFNKKRTLPNLLLGLVLVFMAFRIGKSVMLYFGDELEPLFIFAGLSLLLVIGPLLRWYVLTMTRAHFRIPRNFLAELVPFILVLVMSFFITKDWFDENNKQAVIVFASSIIFIYLHLAFYILMSARMVKKIAIDHPKAQRTKSQTALLKWLRLLLVGFVFIWGSYVLNIIEDTVPYIVGPIVYSLVIYYLSYQAFRLKATQIDGEVFAKNDNAILFEEITGIMQEKKIYLESDVSLGSLSALLEKSTQKTSEAINQYAKQNFNDFINYYRIQHAKSLLLDGHAEKYTISSIAFDIGFSSLSSFNTAFKKFEGITPSAYRKRG